MTDTRDTAPLVLGTEKIGKLLMQYAIPAIIAMTASSLYNMVDSILSVMEWDHWRLRDWILHSRL